MNKYRRFVVYPIKHGDTSSFGIVEYDKENEIAGRYGIYVGHASHTDIFREYSKFIIGLLEGDEQVIVQSHHRTITKKRHEFPRLRYAIRSEVLKFSYCYYAARIAQITQTNSEEKINQTQRGL